MKIKHMLSLLALASCTALSAQALAQSTGTLDIKGFISPVSCTPNLTGGAISGNTLTMPDAFVDNLNAAGATTGETSFSFDLSGCTTSAGINNMWVHFSGSNVDGAGRLQPASGSANLRFELVNGPGGTPIVAGGTAGTGGPTGTQGTAVAFSGTNPNRSASKTYAVRYYAQNALTTADIGAASTAVTYTVQYY